MKLVINENPDMKETEIVIRCAEADDRIRRLTDYIQQFSEVLKGRIEQTYFFVPLDTILYIDSVDKKTFFYDRHRIYACGDSLETLEKKLGKYSFVRISKNCIVNLLYVQGFEPCENHRLKLTIDSGECLIAARTYKNQFKEKAAQLNGFLYTARKRRGETDENIWTKEGERSVLNDGRILRFFGVPARAAAMSYEGAEIMAALGLEKNLSAVVPAEGRLNNLLPAYQKTVGQIPLLKYEDDGISTLTALRALSVDFVLGSYFFKMTAGLKETKDFFSADMPVYIAEATVPGQTKLESLYRDILNIGKIFHAQSRAVSLTNELRERAAVLKRFVRRCRSVPVFVYDSRETQPYTSFADTMETELIRLAGGRNIFDEKKGTYGPVTWEEAAEKNPEVIIIHDYADYMSAAEKKALIQKQPQMQSCPAVVSQRFVFVTLSEVFAGIQNVRTVEKFIRAFHWELI